MPFRLTNAPATFQEQINNVLREYLDIFAIAYLDDILIYSKTLEEHKKHVRTILTTLLKEKLYLNRRKCEFHVKSTTFLSFVVEPGIIKINPVKINHIKE
jgi:hypothetical protein